MDLDSRSWIDWNVLFRGGFEPRLASVMKRLAVEGAVAFDIGANIGVHSLTLARAVGAGGRVLAFEPNPPVRRVLTRNLALNRLDQVIVFECALGSEAGKMELRVPDPASPEASNPGLASLVALETAHHLVRVPVRTVDQIVDDVGLDRVDLVKIDVQGYEYDVLLGMRDTLNRFSPALIFEYDEWPWQQGGRSLAQVCGLLGDAGYGIWDLTDRQAAALDERYPDLLTPDFLDLFALRQGDPRLDLVGINP